ncbi:MAG: glycoside hydrolase family 127 protein, partial [Proteobacteria bacterium]|nr:glycoside hydrolase family 127 protein [Candidatus Avisuccinivibrio stercorigallinarum]
MKVKVTSKFWQQRQRCIKEKMIPYQWQVINDLNKVEISQVGAGMDAFDAAKSYVVENFKIAAGTVKGKRGGMVFQDSDAYKWLEAAAYTLEVFPDADLKA